MDHKSALTQKWRAWTTSPAYLTLVVSMAGFTDTLTYSLIIPAAPTILKNRLGVVEDDVQFWLSILFAVFGAGFIITFPISSYLFDNPSNFKIPFLLSLMILIASITIYAFSTSLPAIVVARGLQGVASAFMMVSSVAKLVKLLHPASLGVAFGFLASSTCIGELVGVILGSLVYEKSGFGAVFGLVIAVIVIDFFFRACLLVNNPQETDAQDQREVQESADQSLLVHEQREYGTTNRHQDESTTDSLSRIQSAKSSASSLPPSIHLAVHRQTTAPLAAIFLAAFIHSNLETTLVVFVQAHFSWSLATSGLTYLVLLLPNVLGLRVTFLPETGKYCTPSLLAAFIAVPTLVGLGVIQLNIDPSDTDETAALVRIVFEALLFVLGGCMATLVASNMAAISAAADAVQVLRSQGMGPAGATGQAYAVFGMLYALGQLLGPLVGGGLAATVGWLWMCVALAALTAGYILLLLVMTRLQATQETLREDEGDDVLRERVSTIPSIAEVPDEEAEAETAAALMGSSARTSPAAGEVWPAAAEAQRRRSREESPEYDPMAAAISQAF